MDPSPVAVAVRSPGLEVARVVGSIAVPAGAHLSVLAIGRASVVDAEPARTDQDVELARADV